MFVSNRQDELIEERGSLLAAIGGEEDPVRAEMLAVELEELDDVLAALAEQEERYWEQDEQQYADAMGMLWGEEVAV